jgi:hypothetical protein
MEKIVHHHVHSHTVKARNFGPHGNFGPIFQKGLLSLKCVLQKNEENKSCRKTSHLQILFTSSVHFLYMIRPQKLQSLKEKVQNFHQVKVSKLGAFTVVSGMFQLLRIPGSSDIYA